MKEKKEAKQFLKEFIKNKKLVGSVHPSSKTLTEKMLENINFDKSKIMVEFGPGTGVITKKIVEKMSADATLLVFELHKPFYDNLVEEFKDKPKVKIFNLCAEKLNMVLKENGFEYTDVIISSLPFSNFSKDLTIKILKSAINCLKHGGKFIQFQYSLANKKTLKNLFDQVSIKFTVNNIPPAWVYLCVKKQISSFEKKQI